jgi:hypothetical protein
LGKSKSAKSLTPPATGLSGTHFIQHLKVLESMITTGSTGQELFAKN